MIMFAGAASVEVLCVLPRFVGQSVRTKGKLDHAPPTTFEVLCAGCAIEGSCASQTHLRRPFHTTMARMGRKAKNKKGVVHQGRSPNEVAAVVMPGNAEPEKEDMNFINAELQKKRAEKRDRALQATLNAVREAHRAGKVVAERRAEETRNHIQRIHQNIDNAKRIQTQKKMLARRPKSTGAMHIASGNASRRAWKPTPSNTVNVLFDPSHRVHVPYEDKSPMELEELQFLSPRSFRSKEGKRSHESRIHANMKPRQEFKVAQERGGGVFQHHRPLSARAPHEYPSKRGPQNVYNDINRNEPVSRKGRKRAHKHFRYHVHANNMTAFKSTIAQTQVPYDTVILQRVVAGSVHTKQRPSTASSGCPRPISMMAIPKSPIQRPRTARIMVPVQPINTKKLFREGCFRVRKTINTSYNETSSDAAQAKAYGHYNNSMEMMKHDDVAQAFVVSKTEGFASHKPTKANLRSKFQALLDAEHGDDAKTVLYLRNLSRKKIEKLQTAALAEQTRVDEATKRMKLNAEKLRFNRAYLNISKRRYHSYNVSFMKQAVALNSQLNPKKELLSKVVEDMLANITEEDLAQYRNVVDQSNKSILRVPKEIKPLLAAIGWILGSVEPPIIEEQKTGGKKVSILKLIGKNDWEEARKILFRFDRAKDGERLQIFVSRIRAIDIQHVRSDVRIALGHFKNQWHGEFEKQLRSKKKKTGEHVALGLGRWLFGCLELWDVMDTCEDLINNLETMRTVLQHRRMNYLHWKGSYQTFFENDLILSDHLEKHAGELKKLKNDISKEELDFGDKECKLKELLRAVFGVDKIDGGGQALEYWVSMLKRIPTVRDAENNIFQFARCENKTLLLVSFHIDSKHILRLDESASRSVPKESRNLLEKLTLCKYMETLTVPHIEKHGGVLCSFASDLTHFAALFSQSDDAVLSAMAIQHTVNAKMLGQHRLSLYVDTFEGYSLGVCGVSHNYYAEHRKAYAMSSHRQTCWREGKVRALTFCTKDVEFALGDSLGEKLFFNKFSRFLYTLSGREDFEHALPVEKAIVVVDNIVLNREMNAVQSLNIAKCFSRLVGERLGLNRPRVVSQMWHDASHMLWKNVGVLVLRCGSDNVYDSALSWCQPTVPKRFVARFLHHRPEDSEISIVCETLKYVSDFDHYFNAIMTIRNPHEEKNHNPDIFPPVVALAPMNVSLFQPVRACISRSMRTLVEIALEMRKLKDKLPGLQLCMTYGPALVSIGGDFFLGPASDQMNGLHRRRPKQRPSETILLDKFAKRRIDFEKVILPHTGWEEL